MDPFVQSLFLVLIILVLSGRKSAANLIRQITSKNNAKDEETPDQ